MGSAYRCAAYYRFQEGSLSVNGIRKRWGSAVYLLFMKFDGSGRHLEVSLTRYMSFLVVHGFGCEEKTTIITTTTTTRLNEGVIPAKRGDTLSGR